MYNPAKQGKSLIFSFDCDQAALRNTTFPGIESVHCYPLKRGGIGRFTTRLTTKRQWAVEYHSRFAGEVIFPGNRRLRREAESVHLYAPGCAYREDTTHADFPIQETYICFQFSPPREHRLNRLVGPNRMARFLAASRVGDLILAVVTHCETHGSHALFGAQASLLNLIDLLCQAEQQAADTWKLSHFSRDRPLSFATEVKTFLRNHLGEKIRIADVARRLKVSESTLSHRFHQETGQTVMARLMALRIEFAKSLLIKGEPLKMIAEMTGFCDEHHLSRSFKKATGQSPRTFRNQATRPE